MILLCLILYNIKEILSPKKEKEGRLYKLLKIFARKLYGSLKPTPTVGFTELNCDIFVFAPRTKTKEKEKRINKDAY